MCCEPTDGLRLRQRYSHHRPGHTKATRGTTARACVGLTEDAHQVVTVAERCPVSGVRPGPGTASSPARHSPSPRNTEHAQCPGCFTTSAVPLDGSTTGHLRGGCWLARPCSRPDRHAVRRTKALDRPTAATGAAASGGRRRPTAVRDPGRALQPGSRCPGSCDPSVVARQLGLQISGPLTDASTIRLSLSRRPATGSW